MLHVCVYVHVSGRKDNESFFVSGFVFLVFTTPPPLVPPPPRSISGPCRQDLELASKILARYVKEVILEPNRGSATVFPVSLRRAVAAKWDDECSLGDLTFLSAAASAPKGGVWECQNELLNKRLPSMPLGERAEVLDLLEKAKGLGITNGMALCLRGTHLCTRVCLFVVSLLPNHRWNYFFMCLSRVQCLGGEFSVDRSLAI